MNTDSPQAFNRRLKSHVIGRARRYFVVAAPGFEALCRDELAACDLPVEALTTAPGGVEFTGRLAACQLANLHLRTANRVLMRIAEFKATNFRQVDRQAAAVPWELFVRADAAIEVRAATRHSRLYHSGAIAEHVQAAIAARLGAAAPPAPPAAEPPLPQQVFVRSVDDRFTLSLDSSGPNLYQRGLKAHQGAAPLRETLAAAILRAAGYDGRRPLIDPMCGTGTFALEAALIALNIPPGWFRTFAFTAWPAFRAQQWAFLRQSAERHFRSLDRPLIFASDREAPNCRALHARLADYEALNRVVAVQQSDFFELSPSALSSVPGLVVINPPYGRRLGTPQASDRLFGSLCAKLQSAYRGWRAALIVPRPQLLETIPFTVRTLPLVHGGLPLTLAIGDIGPSGRPSPAKEAILK